MNRRNFLKVSGIAGGGLMISFNTSLNALAKTQETKSWVPNFFIKINPDNRVTCILTKQEMGQGTSTGLAQILADELGANWDTLRLEFAPGDPVYKNYQDTGGSNSIVMLWKPLRLAAATTREILISAAAKKWNLKPEDCYTKDNYVQHSKQPAKKIRFCDLLSLAEKIPEPAQVKLKANKEFNLIGKEITASPRNQQIVQGKYAYSLNKKLPGMQYAVVSRSPVYKGKVKSFDDKAVRQLKDVEEVFVLEGDQYKGRGFTGGIRQGVVIVAKNTWTALKAKDKLKVTWDEGENAHQNLDTIRKLYDENKNKVKKATHSQGNVDAAMSKAARKITAVYENPSQAHVLMEPLNAVAHFKGDSCEVWAGTQSPQMTRQRIAAITKLPLSAVTIHPSPSGGGYGRRYYTDYVEEAVLISQKTGKPVKLMWTREDGIQTSKYHHYSRDYFEAGFDEKNELIAFDYKGIFPRSYGYCNQPYDIPNLRLHRLPRQRVLPGASWRSVVSHIWGFAQESFIDEIAHATQKDPLKLRLELLKENRIIHQKRKPWVMFNQLSSQLRNVLEVVEKKANWGRKMPVNSGQGVAACIYNGSYCAQVAEVSVNNGKLKVNKITAVVDCGLVVNPSLARNQIEGSILWGLSAVLHGGIKLKNGKVQQSNFHDFELTKINETPEINIHFIESNHHPNGIGEPAVPPVAPAILNAIFAASGKRVRTLPVEL